MTNVKAVCFFFVAVALLLHECSAHDPLQRLRSLERVKRRVGSLEIDVTPVEYMIKVGALIADEEGKPKDLMSAPTSVWCFLDKALVDGVHRPKPTGEGGKCGAISRFVFRWEALGNTTTKELTQSIIRPYMQVINRLIQDGETIPVNMSVSLKLLNHNRQVNESTTHFHFIQTINVTTQSNGWLELDITPAVQSVWTLHGHQPPIVEVTLRMEVDCIDHKKVPIQFINPAEVELSKPVRRQKHTKLQPLLVIYLNDQLVKEKLIVEQELSEKEVALAREGADISVERDAMTGRRKRSLFSSPYACRLENYTVNFTELKLDNIISPISKDIKRCAGNCTHDTIKLARGLATNHAKIMASAKLLSDQNGFEANSTMYSQNHKNPCCVPIEYKSLFILLKFADSLHHQLFPNFVVTKCGCR